MGILYENLDDRFDSIRQTVDELLRLEIDGPNFNAARYKLDQNELLSLANDIICLAAKVNRFEYGLSHTDEEE